MVSPVRSFISVLGSKLATSNYTDGTDSKHDEVNVLGEQFLPTYIVTTAGTSTATANSHLLEIMAGASLKVRIRRIEMHQYIAATTAALMETRLLRLTSAGTGGTVSGLSPLDTADAAAGATAMTLPTVKGTESGNPLGIARPYMMQTLGASAQLSQPILVWDFDRPRSKPLIIQAGVALGVCVKNIDAIAAANVVFMVWLDESSY